MYLSLKSKLEMLLLPTLDVLVTNTTLFATNVKNNFRVVARVIEDGSGTKRHRGHCSDGGGERYGGGDDDGGGNGDSFVDGDGDGDGDEDGGGDGDGDGVDDSNPQVGSVMVLWGLLLCYTTKVILVSYNTSLLNTVPHVRFFQFFSSTLLFKVVSDHGEFRLLWNL